MPGLADKETRAVETPWGQPSDDVVIGTLHGTRTAFLPRHGRGHRFTPTEVNYRANIAALKSLGCEFVVSVSAVGSMKEAIAPGHLVVVDQFIDRTVARPRTFFGDGVVGHITFSDPICPVLRPILLDAAKKTGTPTHDGGVYICIEGPQFSTRAESLLYRTWGVSVIGMTNMPEARLAREAGLSYATLALATDYDCWHESEADVDVAAVIAVLKQNADLARSVVVELAKAIASSPRISAEGCMQHAIITHKDAITADARRRLQLLIGKYLG